ncbi:hypothetical protein [Nocardia crassostreae]|uniref:hypothetical protein n=1 Tax=Nocardia crassostreae TaxID=53428 RepID=UPI0008315E8E|nr:hypothetical protein [Nocardia crassostreae]
MIKTLDESGHPGAEVHTATQRITDLHAESRAAHLDILENLLRILIAEQVEKTFTSQDLLASGVVDTPPNSWDYPWDGDEA